MIRYIVIKTQFEALHCWPDCGIAEVAFLRYLHRHIFHVKVKWKVSCTNREKEFIVMKRKVNLFLEKWEGRDLGRMSCEDIADKIHQEFPDSCFVSVFEDDENGVEVIYNEEKEIVY